MADRKKTHMERTVDSCTRSIGSSVMCSSAHTLWFRESIIQMDQRKPFPGLTQS
jgi:hypothetical protein